jgi:hypothetical protein
MTTTTDPGSGSTMNDLHYEIMKELIGCTPG